MEKIKIDKNTLLMPGDIIEMHFDVIGGEDWLWWRATQLAIIETSLKKKHSNYELLSWSNRADEVVFTFEVLADPLDTGPQVQQAGILVTAIIATTVIAGGLFVWLTFREAYKITQTPAGKIGTVSIAVIIVVLLFFIVKKWR